MFAGVGARNSGEFHHLGVATLLDDRGDVVAAPLRLRQGLDCVMQDPATRATIRKNLCHIGFQFVRQPVGQRGGAGHDCRGRPRWLERGRERGAVLVESGPAAEAVAARSPPALTGPTDSLRLGSKRSRACVTHKRSKSWWRLADLKSLIADLNDVLSRSCGSGRRARSTGVSLVIAPLHGMSPIDAIEVEDVAPEPVPACAASKRESRFAREPTLDCPHYGFRARRHQCLIDH